MAVRSPTFDLVAQRFGNRGVPTEVDDANDDAQDEALDFVVLRWPVDTGVSRDGWFIEEVGALRWRLANDVEYVEHVHDGLWVGLVDEALGEAEDIVLQVVEGLDL